MIKELGKQNSILNHYIAELRDVEIQRDSLRFRKNLERCGEIFAYEISKYLEYEERETHTPLGVLNVPVLKSQPVIATILRAGLPFHQGLLNIFDHAENAFISAFRKHHKDGRLEIVIEYLSSPVLEGKVLILTDPMLASGHSMVQTYRALQRKGKPKHTHIVSLITSAEGINYLKKFVSDEEMTIWTGAIDEELTVQAYIVPGLGDAGDLAFGPKSSD
ncbi:MAG: uracil phosphoribosyltransferase [Bacteroidota bacterium]